MASDTATTAAAGRELDVRVATTNPDRPLNWDTTLYDPPRPPRYTRDDLGRVVREAWVAWALTQPDPKSSWLVPYDDLNEPDKEADRLIGEAVRRAVLGKQAAP